MRKGSQVPHLALASVEVSAWVSHGIASPLQSSTNICMAGHISITEKPLSHVIQFSHPDDNTINYSSCPERILDINTVQGGKWSAILPIDLVWKHQSGKVSWRSCSCHSLLPWVECLIYLHIATVDLVSLITYLPVEVHPLTVDIQHSWRTSLQAGYIILDHGSYCWMASPFNMSMWVHRFSHKTVQDKGKICWYKVLLL